ncbi:peptide/nickel transport system permease protein [Rhizobiales bacterium GAS191]|nr:peptide/nickel transport system permease protein [Rhizobiales bacterium GAS113]SEE70216.1 peptide/nickel transport system permease protein [Rhizobiales bacterium GAS191]
MSVIASIAAPPAPVSLLKQLQQPRFIIALILLMWVPLTANVMLAGSIDETHRSYLLLPAIPATLVLYVVAVLSWRESPIAVVGVSLIFFWLIVAVTVPFLPLVDPNKPFAPFATIGAVKANHYFALGADFKGRDMLARTLWGCQRVLVWGVTATFVAYVVGCMFGLLAGYLGGWWDQAISFLANILLSFPVMVLFILILNYLGPSGFNIIIAVTFASAPAIMRIVRGLTFDTKNRDYIFAAQTRGEHPLRIMIYELLPNARGPIIVDACLRLGYTTVAITTLTFLGLGLQPPDPDWGLMIKEAANVAKSPQFAYMLLIPALSVSSLILGFNLIADGLREMSLRD